jgi:hypothetical protein
VRGTREQYFAFAVLRWIDEGSTLIGVSLGEVRLESLVVVAKSPGRRNSISKYPHPLPPVSCKVFNLNQIAGLIPLKYCIQAGLEANYCIGRGYGCLRVLSDLYLDLLLQV